MKSRILAIGIIGIILFSALAVYAAELKRTQCSCKCGEERISAKGFADSAEIAKERCQDMCGRSCGARTDCSDECESCCSGWCATITDGNDGCLEACKKACELRELVYSIRDLIYIAAAIVAAIMFIIHGLKLITSADPEDREDAKRSLFFVIFALIIIAISGTLVTEFASKIEIAEEMDVVSGCGSDLRHEVRQTNGNTRFEVYVHNNGDTECKYKITIKDLTDQTLIFDGNPKTATPGNPTDTWVKTRDTDDLNNGYIIKLFQTYPETEEPEKPLREEKHSFLSDKTEEVIKEIGDKLIACWKENKPKMKDKVCYKDIKVAHRLEETDVISEKNIEDYLGSQGASEVKEAFILLNLNTITRDTGGLCINFNAKAGLIGHSRIYLRPSLDGICT